MFTNYSAFLTGANSIANEITLAVVGTDVAGSGKTGAITSDNSDEVGIVSSKDARLDMKTNMWNVLVNRPYVYMMFNDAPFHEIMDGDSSSRFANIVKHKPNSEERIEAVVSDIEESGYKNTAMHNSNVTQRLGFTPIYNFINGIIALPVMILSFFQIILQIWFLLIAMFAPFAMIVAAIPGQFNVFKTYMIELLYPLLGKVIISFSILLLFYMSNILYTIDRKVMTHSEGTLLATIMKDPLIVYMLLGVINAVMFIVFFIVWKRMKKVITSGTSEFVQGIAERETTADKAKNIAKKGVQTTATVAGTAVGAVTGGVAGAGIGASIGATAGKLATGEGSTDDVINTGISTGRHVEMAQLKQMNEANALRDMEDKEKRQEIEDQERREQEDREFATQVDQEDLKENKEMKNYSKEDVDSAYDSLTDDEKDDIKVAGDHKREIEQLKNTPIGELSDDDRAKIEAYDQKQADREKRYGDN